MTQPVQAIDVLLAEHAELELALQIPRCTAKSESALSRAPVSLPDWPRSSQPPQADVRATTSNRARAGGFRRVVRCRGCRIGGSGWAELDAQLLTCWHRVTRTMPMTLCWKSKSGEGRKNPLFAAPGCISALRRAARLGGDWTRPPRIWVGRDVGDCQPTRSCGRA